MLTLAALALLRGESSVHRFGGPLRDRDDFEDRADVVFQLALEDGRRIAGATDTSQIADAGAALDMVARVVRRA